MRASKDKRQKTDDRGQKRKNYKIHISGAEGIYDEADILKVVRQYTKRALNHSKGKPDNIVITIEEIKERPKKVKILPVLTAHCDSPDKAKKIIAEKLSSLGISKRAISNAFNILTSEKTMRGASLISLKTGKRLEPDKERGVRVSHLGLEKSSKVILSKKLSKMKINTTTVKEALALASKVASHPEIVAEVCISDDPDYTTGYFASKQFGYIRIPNIKIKGQTHGGRVFFIYEGADKKEIIEYLEKIPVLLTI
jgi:6-carboxyhexanoate--CoA ligase